MTQSALARMRAGVRPRFVAITLKPCSTVRKGSTVTTIQGRPESTIACELSSAALAHCRAACAAETPNSVCRWMFFEYPQRQQDADVAQDHEDEESSPEHLIVPCPGSRLGRRGGNHNLRRLNGGRGLFGMRVGVGGSRGVCGAECRDWMTDPGAAFGAACGDFWGGRRLVEESDSGSDWA